MISRAAALSLVFFMFNLNSILANTDCEVVQNIISKNISDTVNNSSNIVDKLIGDNLGKHTKIGRQCLRYENDFRKVVLAELESTIKHYSFLENCLNSDNRKDQCIARKPEIDSLVNGLKKYRSKNLKLHTELVNNWIDNLPNDHKQVAKKCFKSDSQLIGLSDGSILRTQGVTFDDSVRRPRSQINDYSMCQPVSYLWSNELNARKKEALLAPETVSMTREDTNMISIFENNPANILLSQNTKDNPNLSDRELRSSFHVDIAAMKKNLIDFKNKILNLKNKKLYFIYNFENKYKKFISNLPNTEREFALSCKKNSGLIKDCITAREIEGRCGSRSWDLAENILPFFSLIDAMEGYKEVDAAATTGLYTINEAEDRRSALTMQFMLGIPMPPGAFVGVKLGGRVAIKQVDDVTARLGLFTSEESTASILPRFFRLTGMRTNRVAVENALKGLEGTAKMGSCKATCNTFVKRVFTRTRNDTAPLRLDIYNTGSTHYHIRTHSGDIIDPTYQQFFNFGKDHAADVFYGSKDDLIKEIARLRKEVGFNEKVASFFSSRSNEDIFDLIWGKAKLHRSGSDLRYFDNIEETLFD